MKTQSIARQQWRARIETDALLLWSVMYGGIARQQWRARIETYWNKLAPPQRLCIARQQWRARIETSMEDAIVNFVKASPASNGGRGLKRTTIVSSNAKGIASPASNGGRGLKQRSLGKINIALQHRPPAMAGAD